jgi:transcriptional regulator with XRE-family HTH domain
LRKYYNLNISEASKDMGINRNTLGNIERAVGDLNLSTLFLIADFYGIAASELIKDLEEES